MKVTFRTSLNMGKVHRRQMARLPRELAKCNQRRTVRVVVERMRVMDRKLYSRSENPDLTHNLYRGDVVERHSEPNKIVSVIHNVAIYAQHRNDETGISTTWGHDKELHFNEEAVAKTQQVNLNDVKSTVKRVMGNAS